MDTYKYCNEISNKLSPYLYKVTKILKKKLDNYSTI